MKTILDLLIKAGVSGTDLVLLLQGIVAKYPDLAPVAQKLLDELAKTTDPALLAELATTILAELKDAATGHFSGKTHAGDGA